MAEAKKQQDEQQEKPLLRDESGRYLPGTRSPAPFPPGRSGNPTGKACGPVRALARYLGGEDELPESFEDVLPPAVWAVYKEHGLGAALVCSVMAIALNPEVDASDRLKAIEWATARFDGPLVKQLQTANLNLERREVVIVNIVGDGKDPEFPPEVTDVEDAEEEARQEANTRRQEAMGMGESTEPLRSSGRRRKRTPGENGGAA